MLYLLLNKLKWKFGLVETYIASKFKFTKNKDNTDITFSICDKKNDYPQIIHYKKIIKRRED